MSNNIINEQNIKLFCYFLISHGVHRTYNYILFELYEELPDLVILSTLSEKGKKLNDISINLTDKIMKLNDNDFLEFIKKSFEYIYKREYGMDNLWETFDKELEDNYYWILANYFRGNAYPLDKRKYHKELYEFYLEKSQDTLKFLYRKQKQSLKNDPHDNIGCQESIDYVEKYIKRLKSGEFNKFEFE